MLITLRKFIYIYKVILFLLPGALEKDTQSPCMWSPLGICDTLSEKMILIRTKKGSSANALLEPLKNL